jgi:hypothetical protein
MGVMGIDLASRRYRWHGKRQRMVGQARLCDQALHTPAKTGLPGAAKPHSSLRFVKFSIQDA